MGDLIKEMQEIQERCGIRFSNITSHMDVTRKIPHVTSVTDEDISLVCVYKHSAYNARRHLTSDDTIRSIKVSFTYVI